MQGRPKIVPTNSPVAALFGFPFPNKMGTVVPPLLENVIVINCGNSPGEIIQTAFFLQLGANRAYIVTIFQKVNDAAA